MSLGITDIRACSEVLKFYGKISLGYLFGYCDMLNPIGKRPIETDFIEVFTSLGIFF
jgi:hypothetical protein